MAKIKYLVVAILLLICCFLLLWSKSRGEAGSFSRLMSTEWSIVKDDFLVNDDTTGGSNQQYEDAVGPVNGKFVLVWEDYRNGNDADIYGGLYDYSTGNLVKPMFRVNSDTGTTAQNNPAVAMDSMGNFVIVWADSRYGPAEVYGQLYDANGNTIGNNFMVSNDSADGYDHCEPAVARAKDGRFIVAWRDDRNYYVKSFDIYAQFFDKTGNKLGTHFIANDDADKVTQRTPTIAFYAKDKLVIAWMDGRRGETDIYAQRYSLLRLPIGSNYRVNDDTVTLSQQWFPFIASNYGRTVIAWRDSRLSNYPNVFAQIYDSLWNPIGSNFCVNPGRKLSPQGVAEVISCAINQKNEFIVVWNDETRAVMSPDVYFQKFITNFVDLENDETRSIINPDVSFKKSHPPCMPFGDMVKVNDTLSDRIESTTPKIIIDKDGSFIIVWQWATNGQRDILLQRYDANDKPVGKNVQIVPDAGTGNQTDASIAMNGKTDFVTVWLDHPTNKIFGKIYNQSGNPYKPSFCVSVDSNAVSQPAVAIDTSGNFVTVWVSASVHIYGCKYNLSQGTFSPVFKVDSGSQYSQTFSPDVGMDKNGNFAVAWEDYRRDNKFGDIMCQRFTKNCVPIDTNFRVNTLLGQRNQAPCVAMNKNGEFLVIWEQDVNDMLCFDIEGQKYDSSGNTVGGNFKISEDAAGNIQQKNPSAAVREDGKFISVWEDYRNGKSDIYGQICDSSCAFIGSNFMINNSTDTISCSNPSVAASPQRGNFIVSWTKQGSTKPTTMPQIMAQLFDSLGQTQGSNFQLNDANLFPNNQHFSVSKHSIAANDEFCTFSWTDNRRLKGWDIYAKFINQTAGKEDTLSHKSFLSIYPNPAYKKLNIEYEIPQQGTYTIEIYDRTGSRVFSVPPEEKPAGKYTLKVNLSKFSAGVYFVRLKGDGISNINKIIYIK